MAKCIGCGVKLQIVDENALGYVPAHIESDLGENTYCQRCYQIIHNGKKYQPQINSFDYYQKISIIGSERAIIILMIDVMDIFGGFIPKLANYIKNNKVIILVNKIDILPKHVHLKKIEDLIINIAKQENLNVTSVIMISAKNARNIDIVINKIRKIRDDTRYKKYSYHKNMKIVNTYILGCASVGKSTFVNAIKKMYLHDNNLITTSDQFQTTMEFIKVFISKDEYLIDTPGLINYHSFGAYLDYESVKMLTPRSYLKPRTFQLSSNQTIFIGGLVKLDFLMGDKISASFYVSNEVYLHRTKLEFADRIFNEHKLRLLKPPFFDDELFRIKNTKTVNFEIENGNYDLLISGIGFVHLSGINTKIKVKLYENIDVRLVPTFI